MLLPHVVEGGAGLLDGSACAPGTVELKVSLVVLVVVLVVVVLVVVVVVGCGDGGGGGGGGGEELVGMSAGYQLLEIGPLVPA